MKQDEKEAVLRGELDALVPMPGPLGGWESTLTTLLDGIHSDKQIATDARIHRLSWGMLAALVALNKKTANLECVVEKVGNGLSSLTKARGRELRAELEDRIGRRLSKQDVERLARIGGGNREPDDGEFHASLSCESTRGTERAGTDLDMLLAAADGLDALDADFGPQAAKRKRSPGG